MLKGDMMKRVSGFWYYNSITYNMIHGVLVKTSCWQIAGTFERCCMMMRGHG
jgi:hypothetical protein